MTVTRNNRAGLYRTLESLASLSSKPFEVVVVDGGSTDGTPGVLERFLPLLNLRVLSEPDRGIYDAMRKGQALTTGDGVHYLNAGDTVQGEPYSQVRIPALLPVRLLDEEGAFLAHARTTLGGYSYCHQGVILRRAHAPFRPDLTIAADVDVLISEFPDGIAHLPVLSGGEVLYDLAGVSSRQRLRRDLEIASILWRKGKTLVLIGFLATAALKYLLPRRARRFLRRLFR